MSDPNTLVNKLWSYCNVLRDDGLSYGDYLEQLTYLLFLKMAHEYTAPPWSRPSPVPEGYDWPSLLSKDGDDLEIHYRKTLEHLGKQHGLLGLVFRKAQSKIADPAKLRRLVADLIDRETWVRVGVDVKGEAYEGLLERNAQDIKSGAGQYFTPRPLIDAMVACIRPRPGEALIDPACGTGGFLLAAHSYLSASENRLTREQREHLRLSALRGVELVSDVTRLAAMNLMLHGVGPTPQELDDRRRKLIAEGKGPDQADAEIDKQLPVRTDDALRELGTARYDVVLTNPPFGKKSSILVVTDEGDTERESVVYERDDFWASTTNKQLNFVQHVKSLLQIHGRAAVVVPDNVLFEGGAGESVRRGLLKDCDVHTLLRLPTGIFYAQGVKANVLFFDRMPASPDPWTKMLWVYDLRTNVHFTLKNRRMKRSDLDDFVRCYGTDRNQRAATWSEANPQGRWRSYPYGEIVARDKCSLDLFWLKDESLLDANALPDPDVIVSEIAEDLRSALEQIEEIMGDLSPQRAPSIGAPEVDLRTLPTAAWRRPNSDIPAEVQAAFAAVLKAMPSPLPARMVRLATSFALEPQLLLPLLDPGMAEQWHRVIGEERPPLPSGVTRLEARRRRDDAWGKAYRQLRATGRLVVDGDLWGPGDKLDTYDTAGWPDGRAGFVINILDTLSLDRLEDSEDILPESRVVAA